MVTLKVSEGAAYGAALQALWSWRIDRGESVTMSEITDRFVAVNRSEIAEPDATKAEVYVHLQNLQNSLSRSLRPSFALHRQLVASA